MGYWKAQCKVFAHNFRKQEIPAPGTTHKFCEDSLAVQVEHFYFFPPSNRMIYVPTEMPLDAACLNQGEEIEREHEGHVWMISQLQLPAATSGRQQSPGILEEQKELLVQNRWTPQTQNATVRCPAQRHWRTGSEECNGNQPQRQSFKALSYFGIYFKGLERLGCSSLEKSMGNYEG